MSESSRRPLLFAIAMLVVLASAAGLAWQLTRSRRDAAPARSTRWSADELRGGLWVQGQPFAPDSIETRVLVYSRWTLADPRSKAFLARLAELDEAYAPLGVRVIAAHCETTAVLSDTASVARSSRLWGESLSTIALRRPAPLEPECRAYGRSGTLLASGWGMKGLDACDAATREALGGAENGGAPENARAPLPRAITRIALSAGAIARGPLANVALSVPLTLLSQLRPQEESARGVPFPVGRWLQDSSGLVAVRGGAANVLTIRYHAGRVGVLASPPAGRTAKLWILRDENWLSGRAPGEDVRLDEHGASYVELDGTRLYIVDREGGDHIYKFSPEAPGVTLHALTFDDPSGD